MSQQKILDWLYDRKKNGEYYTIKQIADGAKLGKQVHRQVNRLYAWGYLDVDVSYFPLIRKFKLKENKGRELKW